MEIIHGANEISGLYSLLAKSFPPDEIRSEGSFRSIAGNGKCEVYAKKLCGKAVGVMTVWKLCGFLFVEHFAVEPEFRGGGIGKEMLRELLESRGAPVCLEAEPAALSETAARRIRFYERNGFFVNPYYYEQPPYSKSKRFLPLVIMTAPKPIDENTFEAYRENIYKEVYGI